MNLITDHQLKEHSRSRGWCLTINNPKDGDYRILDTITCDYVVYQTEKGTANHTKHIQAFIYFNSAKTFGRMKRIFNTAHMEIARGSANENKEYCTKEDTRDPNGRRNERGHPPAQGGRHDIEAMQRDIVEGLNDVSMFEKYPSGWAQYHRVLRSYRSNRKRSRTTWTKTQVLYGPTGTGKSFRAHKRAAAIDSDYGVMLISEKGRPIWGDGCEDAKAIVIEDFEGEIQLRALLQMLDRYKCNMPLKGGNTNWAPAHVFITSNKHPRHWYEDDYETGPLKRRLTTQGSSIIQMTEVYIEPRLPFTIWQPDTQPPGDIIVSDTETE